MQRSEPTGTGGLMLFALESGREFATRVGRSLGVPLSEHEERDFEYGQHKSRPLVNVRGRDVFVVQSLHGDAAQSVNDKLCRLLFFIGALRDAAAARITAVVPYLCYSRKDAKTKSRDPVTTRYLACLFEAVGLDCMVTVDVHNLAAFQNAFRCRTEHLESAGLFAECFAGLVGDESVVAVSPDIGGIKRVRSFRQTLSRALGRPVAYAAVEKSRSEDVVTSGPLIGAVDGRVAIIYDDIISSGTTMAGAARACRACGARRIYAAASHATFTPATRALFEEPAVDRIAVLDTIAPLAFGPALDAKLVRVETAPFIAETIRRLHEGGSLVELQSGRG